MAPARRLALVLLLAMAFSCGEDPITGGFVAPGPVCIGFCEKVVTECAALQIPLTSCQSNCQQDVNAAFADSGRCGEGFEAFYECVSALACVEVEEWRDADADADADDDYPCRVAVEAANEACEPSNT